MKTKLSFTLFLLLFCIGHVNAVTTNNVTINVNGVDMKFDIEDSDFTARVSTYCIDRKTQGGRIDIPYSITYNGSTYIVTSIDVNAFYKCSITSVSIPSGVRSIGRNAFCDCFGLESISISSGVKEIGEVAFWGCKNLKKVIIQDIAAWCGISFDDDAYDSNPLSYAKHIYSDEETEITDLVIPSSVTEINRDAFIRCSALKSVTIPSSVTRIGDSAFFGCEGLEKVIVQDIAAWCSIDFGHSINPSSNPLMYAHHLYIDENTEITDLVIPSNVTSISQSAFYGCEGIKSVTLTSNRTTIGYKAFGKCTGLTNVTLPDGLLAVGGFSDCTALTSISLPNSVTTIDACAFT